MDRQITHDIKCALVRVVKHGFNVTVWLQHLVLASTV